MIGPAPGIVNDQMLGTWHIVATTLGFWRGRRDATATYAALSGPRWSDTLRFRKGEREHVLVGTDTAHADAPGRFAWRGNGWLAWCTSTWTFAAVAPDGAWAITWFSAATLRVTPEGMDIYSRERSLPPHLLTELLAQTEQLRPGLPEWRTIVQSGVDMAAYGLPTSLD